IRQPDQAYVTIPNAKLTASAITNWSRLQKRWLNFHIGVAYGTTSDQMRKLVQRIREMLKAQEKVDPDSVVVLFTDFGDSSLNVLVRCYILESNWVKFHEHRQEINLNIMDIVADLGLSLASPRRSLYIENLSLMSDGQGARLRPASTPGHAQPLPLDETSSAQYPGASAGEAGNDSDGED